MTELDFETDSFLPLLTDALRSGPGSPAWHEALRILRAGGIESADEYQLLVTAREHLESGKDYRSIRAGAGFTQRLMARLDHDSSSTMSRSPMATAVALGSAGLMLLVLASIGYLLWTAADRGFNDGSNLVTRTVTQWNANLPDDWTRIGDISTTSDRGGLLLKPGKDDSATGGGAYWSQSIDPNEPFAIVATLRIYHFDKDVVTQIFVTDQPDFAPANGMTPHELVWLLKPEMAQVILPGGRFETQSPITPGGMGMLPVRIFVDHGQASVDVSEKRIWSGTIALDPSKPRYVGLRFLRQDPKSEVDGVVVLNMRVDMRPK